MPVKVPINLATEPFRRDRPVLVGTIALIALLLAVLLVQVYIFTSERGQSAEVRILLNRLNTQMTTIQKEQAALDVTLHRPENATVLEYSIFLNQLIQHKAISWTRLFADLEKVLPSNVRLVTVRLPQVDAQNHVWLDMVVAARDSGPVLEFLKRLEAAPQFGIATPMNSLPPSQTDPFYRYRVSVSYAQKL